MDPQRERFCNWPSFLPPQSAMLDFSTRQGCQEQFDKKKIVIVPLHNHPPHIITHIPKIISKDSTNSHVMSKTSIWWKANMRMYYGEVATQKKTNFNSWRKPQAQATKRRRRRSSIRGKKLFFCPPFTSNMKTDFGRKFLNLVQTHVPKDCTLGKILNIHTIKLSYSCMPNMRALMLRHNDKLLGDSEPPAAAGCNCRKQPCPMQCNCLIESIVYEAKIHYDDKTVYYYGSTSNAFKTRWRNHTSSFCLPQKQNDTALASHVWEI